MSRSRNRREAKTSVVREIVNFVILAMISVLAGFLLSTYVVKSVNVSGSSMDPTLKHGQNLFVYKLTQPKRFDVIILQSPDETVDDNGNRKVYVKRVIGMPGDTVAYRDDKLYINGEPYNEPYLDSLRSQIGANQKVMADATLEQILQQARLKMPNLPAGNTALENRNGVYVIPEGYYFVLGDNRPHSQDGTEFGLAHKDLIEGVAILRWWPLTDIRIAPFE